MNYSDLVQQQRDAVRQEVDVEVNAPDNSDTMPAQTELPGLLDKRAIAQAARIQQMILRTAPVNGTVAARVNSVDNVEDLVVRWLTYWRTIQVFEELAVRYKQWSVHVDPRNKHLVEIRVFGCRRWLFVLKYNVLTGEVSIEQDTRSGDLQPDLLRDAYANAQFGRKSPHVLYDEEEGNVGDFEIRAKHNIDATGPAGLVARMRQALRGLGFTSVPENQFVSPYWGGFCGG